MSPTCSIILAIVLFLFLIKGVPTLLMAWAKLTYTRPSSRLWDADDDDEDHIDGMPIAWMAEDLGDND